jgi:NAD(P)-dependent dehydrogenase (short-subunit alcohol dehydrogenase family)
MDLICRDQRVVVTAGASGIGLVVTQSLLAAGARIHVSDIDGDRLAEARVKLPLAGTTVADVADPAAVDRLFDDAKAALGGLDVLINNAGIAGPTKPVEEVTPEEWNRTLAVNITGQFLCARRAVPLLKAAGRGVIVNMSSAAGRFGYPLRAPYAASKWAVIGLTQTLAMELGPDQIRVNAILPGMVAGPRIEAVIAAKAAQQGVSVAAMTDTYIRKSSMHAMVTGQDIANMIVFLCSESGRFISGASIPIDGNVESLRT